MVFVYARYLDCIYPIPQLTFWMQALIVYMPLEFGAIGQCALLKLPSHIIFSSI